MSDLRARLAALGVGVFDPAPEGPASPGDREYPELLADLVRSGDARLRAAIPCVLALHDGPRAAEAVREAIRILSPDDAATLAFLYRIARCLAASRAPDLGFRGLRPVLPPIPEEPAQIPGPEEMLGEKGPWVATNLAHERGVPDLAGDAASMFDLWLRLPAAEHEPARERLRRLLVELGRRFQHPVRLYLSGGSGLRGTTREVDVHYEVSPDHHGAFVNTLRELKEKLSIRIEEAYPGDFVPLPPGSERRCTFVERFGQVDVFLFDPYSVALSKLERGHERDRQDVKALLARRIIEPAELRRLFESILPAYEAQGVKSDSQRFRRALDAALAP